jgi:hypothetical protein
MNSKILIAIICVTISIVLVGVLTIFVMSRNNDDDRDDTTEMMINLTQIDFGGPATATVITAPKVCKNGEKLETKSNTCRKQY